MEEGHLKLKEAVIISNCRWFIMIFIYTEVGEGFNAEASIFFTIIVIRITLTNIIPIILRISISIVEHLFAFIVSRTAESWEAALTKGPIVPFSSITFRIIIWSSHSKTCWLIRSHLKSFSCIGLSPVTRLRANIGPT